MGEQFWSGSIVSSLSINRRVQVHANWVTGFERLMNDVGANEASGPSYLHDLN